MTDFVSVLAIAAITVLVPLYVTISMAFKTQAQAVDGNAFSLPAPFSLEGFTTAWELTNFPVAFTAGGFPLPGTSSTVRHRPTAS